MKIKICGITKREDAAGLDELNIDYCGVWNGVAGGRYDCSDMQAKALLNAETKTLRLVLVTLRNGFEHIDAILSDTRAYAVQLHAFQLPGLVQKIKRRYGETIKVIKTLHVAEENCLEDDVIDYYIDAGVDFFLLDTYLSKREIGSTGKPLRRNAIERLMPRIGCDRAFIAGGVGEDSIAEIHARFDPYGVDIDSAAKVDNQLCLRKVARLVEAMKQDTVPVSE